MKQYTAKDSTRTKLLPGVFGALAGALLGALIWAVIGALGYHASFVGFLMTLLVSKGYTMMHGPQGPVKRGVLIGCIVLAVLLGNIGTYLWSVHAGYAEAFAQFSEVEKQFVMSEADYFGVVLSDLVHTPAILWGFLRDMWLGLLFAGIGCIGWWKNADNEDKAPAVQASADAEPSDDAQG